jgi:hypothetical protein
VQRKQEGTVTKLYLAQIPNHFRVSRGTIYRDIRRGRLSAEDNGKGRTVVDLSELERVYARKTVSGPSHTVQGTQFDTDDSVHENSVLQREVELLRERIAEHHAVIDDLRSERDRLLKMLEEQAGTVKLLTDERQKTQQPARRWWRRS